MLGIWHLNVTSGGLIVGGDFDRVNWFRHAKLARFEGPKPSPLLPPLAVKPPALPQAECTTQFADGFRTLTAITFQAPDRFILRRNDSWFASPEIADLAVMPFEEFGTGFAVQWNVPLDRPIDGDFVVRMGVEGGPTLVLDCAEGDPLVDLGPLTPPAPEPEPEPGLAVCTVSSRTVEFDISVDDERVVVRRNGRWAQTLDAGVDEWEDPAGRANDEYLIRFRENGERRDVECARVAGEPIPEPTCTVTDPPDGTVQIDIDVVTDPESLILRRGRKLVRHTLGSDRELGERRSWRRVHGSREDRRSSEIRSRLRLIIRHDLMVRDRGSRAPAVFIDGENPGRPRYRRVL